MALAKLGFGTSNLMGRIGGKQSLRLMAAAYHAGIRHFDTAPLYGLGAAESMVGEFAADKRSHITIATKFGIRPPRAPVWMGTAKACARIVAQAIPPLRPRLRRRAEVGISRGNFTPEECTQSLRASLQLLRTEYIDFFLMHEVLPGQITGELLAALEHAALAGQIKSAGIATSGAATIAIARTMRSGAVAQFPSSVFAPTADLIPDALEKITHSSINCGFGTLYDQLTREPMMRKEWSRILGFDCGDKDEFGQLFLYSSMTENSGGTVIFSSLSEERIRRNARRMYDHHFCVDQVHLLHNLIHRNSSAGRSGQELTA